MDYQISASLAPSCTPWGEAHPRPVLRYGWRFAIVLVALPSCVSYSPDPLTPTDELSVLNARATKSIRVDHRGPGLASWFPLTAQVRLADGLTLGEANALALFYSPAILKARAEARVAGAQVLQAGVLANPALFLGPRLSSGDSKGFQTPSFRIPEAFGFQTDGFQRFQTPSFPRESKHPTF